MRSFLAVVAAVAALLFVWLWPSAEGTSVESLPAWGGTPVEADESASPEDLVSVPRAVGRAAPEAPERVALSPDIAAVARPKGFSELVVQVVAGTHSVAGAIVEVSEDVDAVLNGSPDDEGRSVTGDDGTVRFFVRPTRTAVIRATDDEASWTSEGTFTTPFEGRSRTVELDIGLARGLGTLPFQVVTELGRTPLPGVTVRVDGPGLPAAIELTTDGDGQVSTTEDWRLTYSFSSPGFVPKALSGASLEDESERPISVVLRPSSTIRGRIDGAYDGPQPITREQFERGSLRPRDIKTTRQVVLRMREGALDRGFRVATMIGADGGTFTGSYGGYKASVSADGTWSARVAVEDGESEWRGVEVELLLPDETRRILGVIDRLRPGDDVVVPDPWPSAKPLNLAVQDAAGEPIAVGRRIYLSQVSTDAARTDSVTSAEVDAEGRASFARLPVGSWSYFIEISGAPPSWSYSGAFVHSGRSETLALSLTTLPLTVRLARGADDSVARTRGIYMLSIAKAGAAASPGIIFREGDHVTFPFVPAGVGWEVVLVQATHYEFLDGARETRKPKELHRVPVGPGAREIVLELK